MQELFRFSVVRPATRINAPTLSLERGQAVADTTTVASTVGTITFQDQLRETTAQLKSWDRLEAIAFNYFANNPKWILSEPLIQDLQIFLEVVQSLSSDELTPDKWPGTNWLDNAKIIANLFQIQTDKQR